MKTDTLKNKMKSKTVRIALAALCVLLAAGAVVLGVWWNRRQTNAPSDGTDHPAASQATEQTAEDVTQESEKQAQTDGTTAEPDSPSDKQGSGAPQQKQIPASVQPVIDQLQQQTPQTPEGGHYERGERDILFWTDDTDATNWGGAAAAVVSYIADVHIDESTGLQLCTRIDYYIYENADAYEAGAELNKGDESIQFFPDQLYYTITVSNTSYRAAQQEAQEFANQIALSS